MYFQDPLIILSFLLLLGLGARTTAFGNNYDLVPSGRLADHSRPERSLSAARKVSNIKARNIEGCLVHGLDLHYVEGSAGTARYVRYLS